MTLELGGDVQTGIDRLIANVERLDRLVKGTADNFTRLAGDIRALGTAGRSVQSLNRAMEKLSTGGGKGVGDMERMATAARSMTTASERLTTTLRANARLTAEMAKASEAAARASASGGGAGGGGGRGGRGHGSGRGFGGHDWMLTGMGASMVGEPLVRGGETAFERGLEVAHLRTQILADQRVSQAQADALVNKAYEATTTAPGTRVAENLHAAIDLKQVTGSVEEAEALLPRFAQLTALLQVMDRRKGGTGDSAFAAAKALELMGGMIDEHTDASGHTVREINPELMQKRLDMMARVSVAFNARIGPQDYLGFARKARVAGMNLSDEFKFERLPAIMLGMGGPQAGTALMSMAQVFEGGKLTAKSMEALQEIGLAGPEGLSAEAKQRGRGGKMVSRMAVHPEAIYDLALLRTDPDKWVNAAQTRMEAAGIHGTENQIVALMKASQRTTIAGALADLLKDRPLIEKEQQNIINTRPDVAAHFAQNDPAAKLQQMQAAFDKLVTTLGSASMDDAVKLMNAATSGLNALGDWAKEHPGMARLLTDTAAGLGAVATALGTISTAIFLFGPALKALGIVSGGGAAAGGAAAATGGGGLGLASRLAMGVGAGGLAGAGIVTGIGLVESQLDPLTEAQKQRHAPWLSDDLGFGFDKGGHPLTAPPPTASNTQMNVQLQGSVNMDGRKVGEITASGLARAGSGPSTGTTGFDTRGGNVGSMPGIP